MCIQNKIKSISKSTAFILLGATVVGSSMNIYAQQIPQRETNCTIEIECLENESVRNVARVKSSDMRKNNNKNRTRIKKH